MSAALYPVLESEIQGVDVSSVDGKFLSKTSEVLDSIANQIGVPSLMSFYGADMSDFLEEEGLNELETDEKWFAPSDGLQTVQALLKFIKENPNTVENADNITTDLYAFEQVLLEAEKRNVRWHLAVDF